MDIIENTDWDITPVLREDTPFADPKGCDHDWMASAEDHHPHEQRTYECRLCGEFRTVEQPEDTPFGEEDP